MTVPPTFDIVIIWEPVIIPDLDYYKIYRYNWTTLLWDLIGKSTTNSYIDKDMPIPTLPQIGYWYDVSAVDKMGLEGPSDITTQIFKSVPPDQIPPSAPTDVRAVRGDDLQSVTISWAENSVFEEVKGYLIERMVWDGNTPTTWETIAITSANKFVDSTMFKKAYVVGVMSYVSYAVYAYDKDLNGSLATASNNLWIPAAKNIRAIIDYLTVNLFWENPLPEEATVTTIYAGVNVAGTWYRGARLMGAVWVVASVQYPATTMSLDGFLDAAGNGFPFNQGQSYGFSPFFDTGGVHGINPVQEGWKLIAIPVYPTDTVPPLSPLEVMTSYDEQLDILYVTWAKHDSGAPGEDMDDDVLYWQVQYDYTGAGNWTSMLNTTQNTCSIRNATKFGAYVTGVYNLSVRVRAVDRSNNKSAWTQKSTRLTFSKPYLNEYILCTDCTDITTDCYAAFPTLVRHDPAGAVLTSYMRFDIFWNCIDRIGLRFKQFLVFWTTDFDISQNPIWDLSGGTASFTKGCCTITTDSKAYTILWKSGSLTPWSSAKIAFCVGVLDGSGILHFDNANRHTVVCPA